MDTTFHQKGDFLRIHNVRILPELRRHIGQRIHYEEIGVETTGKYDNGFPVTSLAVEFDHCLVILGRIRRAQDPYIPPRHPITCLL